MGYMEMYPPNIILAIVIVAASSRIACMRPIATDVWRFE